jgi:hypothetical protein
MSASKVAASAARLALLARVWTELVGIRPTRRRDENARACAAEAGFGDTAFGQYRFESAKMALPAQRDPPPPPAAPP